MALALYRKYRPRTFAEVIGQEHVTEPLSQALRTGRLHHAYLFSGPRGCGKTSSARILARSLNCEKGPTPEPCGECQPCRDLAPDGAGSIDVIEIDAASHGGVDDARDLRERAFFAPVASRYKVYVIDEAHMVSSAGFNALLKLVEEPPDYVKFVFATTEPEKVLGTIKSRTHHYPFRLIPPGVLRPYLEQLCGSEGVLVEPAVFPLVVRAGAGSVRDSLSVLDQLIAGAGPEGVTYARAVALLGVTDAALLDEACDALGAGDGAAVFATIDRVAEAGHDSRRFAADLLERLRDLIVLQQVPDAAAKGLLDVPADQLERMAGQATRIGPATLSRFADIVHDGLTEMRGTTAPRLLLELICARMLLPGAEESTGSLLQRLERMERRLTLTSDAASGAPATPAPSTTTAPPARSTTAAAPAPSTTAAAPGPAAPAAPVAPAAPAAPTAPVVPVAPVARAAPAVETAELERPPAQPAASGAIDAAGVRRVWDEILRTVGNKSKKVAAWAREATVREVDGETLVLAFRHSFHAAALAANPEPLTDAVTEILGGQWQVRCDFTGSDAATAAARPAKPAPAPAPQARPSAPARTPEAGPSETWPTIAVPGGQPADAPTTPKAPQTRAAQTTAPQTRAAQTTAPQTRAAPTKAGPRRPAGKGRSAARGPANSPANSPANGQADDDAPPADEPPFDPDYDAPGFDPGDEPMEEAGTPTIRESSEDQALRLLSEAFGAEKIGD